MHTLFIFSFMSHVKVSVFLVCVKLDVMPNHQILAGYAPGVARAFLSFVWGRGKKGSGEHTV